MGLCARARRGASDGGGARDPGRLRRSPRGCRWRSARRRLRCRGRCRRNDRSRGTLQAPVLPAGDVRRTRRHRRNGEHPRLGRAYGTQRARPDLQPALRHHASACRRFARATDADRLQRPLGASRDRAGDPRRRRSARLPGRAAWLFHADRPRVGPDRVRRLRDPSRHHRAFAQALPERPRDAWGCRRLAHAARSTGLSHRGSRRGLRHRAPVGAPARRPTCSAGDGARVRAAVPALRRRHGFAHRQRRGRRFRRRRTAGQCAPRARRTHPGPG